MGGLFSAGFPSFRVGFLLGVVFFRKLLKILSGDKKMAKKGIYLLIQKASPKERERLRKELEKRGDKDVLHDFDNGRYFGKRLFLAISEKK